MLLNLDPRDPDPGFSEEDFITELEKDPKLCDKKYHFDTFEGMIYPFSMLCALGASRTVLKACAKASPISVSYRDKVLGSPIHYACEYQLSLDLLKYLAKKTPQAFFETDKHKRTPLHIACASAAPTECIIVLIEKNPQAAAIRDFFETTPLHYICANSTLEWDAVNVSLLIEAYPQAATIQSKLGATPLHLALAADAPNYVIKQLIHAGKPALKKKDKDGCIPLFIAVKANSSLKKFKLLVKYYPDGRECLNGKGQTPWMMAKRLSRDPDVIRVLDPSEESYL
jgi:ankyrin repeat protein